MPTEVPGNLVAVGQRSRQGMSTAARPGTPAHS